MLHAAEYGHEDGGVDQICRGVGGQQPQALYVAALLVPQTGDQPPGQLDDLPHSPCCAAVLRLCSCYRLVSVNEKELSAVKNHIVENLETSLLLLGCQT